MSYKSLLSSLCVLLCLLDTAAAQQKKTDKKTEAPANTPLQKVPVPTLGAKLKAKTPVLPGEIRLELKADGSMSIKARAAFLRAQERDKASDTTNEERKNNWCELATMTEGTSYYSTVKLACDKWTSYLDESKKLAPANALFEAAKAEEQKESATATTITAAWCALSKLAQENPYLVDAGKLCEDWTAYSAYEAAADLRIKADFLDLQVYLRIPTVSHPERLEVLQEYMSNYSQFSKTEEWKTAKDLYDIGSLCTICLQEEIAVSFAKKEGRRFALVGNGTVIDTKTNYMWSLVDNGVGKQPTAEEAIRGKIAIGYADAEKYAASFKGGGYTDWRLPKLEEIQTLYEASSKGYFTMSGKLPAIYVDWNAGKAGTDLSKQHAVKIDDLFRLSGSEFWLRDARVSDAKLFSLATKAVTTEAKDKKLLWARALPIRIRKDFLAEEKAIAKAKKDGKRFAIVGNGTVIDTQTKLMWPMQDSAETSPEGENWLEASEYCKLFEGGNYNDWRMPTLAELKELYGTVVGTSAEDLEKRFWTQQAVPSIVHKGKPESGIDILSLVWSSDKRDGTYAGLDFYNGGIYWLPPSKQHSLYRAIPVRVRK